MFNALRSRPNLFRPGFANGRSPSTTADTRLLQALDGNSGYGQLAQALTINSVTVAAPTMLYQGDQASGSAWTATVGPNLATASTGTDPTTGAYAPGTLSTEKCVAMQSGKAWQAADTTTGNLGTDDFVVEAWFRMGSVAGACAMAKADVGGTKGWMLEQTGTTGVALWMKNAGVSTLVSGPTVTAGSWIHVITFNDRSEASTNGAVTYVNGTAGTGVNMSSYNLSVDTTDALRVGSFTDFTQKGNQQLAWLAMWRSPAWFAGGATNPSQWAVVARDRFLRLCGLYPSLFTGTALPSTATRSSSAYLDRLVDSAAGERRLFRVDANWIRYGERQELAGGENLKGVLVEAQSTNLCLQSETVDNASWTKAGCAVSANNAAAPTGDTVADGIVADGTGGIHAVTQAVTLTAASYVFSAWLKAGNQPFAILEDATLASGKAWFNLSGAGTVGTVGANVTEATIEKWGNGWYRCAIRFTGTVAAHTLAIYPAPSDNVSSFTGDSATVNLSVFGAQVEQADHASSYIPTTTASVSRTLDTLAYVANDGNFAASSPGLLQADVIHPARDALSVQSVATLCASASSLGTDSIRLEVAASGDVGSATMVQASATQYAITGTTDVVDGEKHTLKTTWDTNDGRLFVDGAQEGSTDTSVTIISSAPAVLLVGDFNSTGGSNALVGNLVVRRAVA